MIYLLQIAEETNSLGWPAAFAISVLIIGITTILIAIIKYM